MKICAKAFLKICACLVLWLAFFSSHAQTSREYFMLANGAHKNGDYQKALENYEAARLAGDDSAELYFNMANTFAKMEKFGLAELNYMRAIYRKPRFREASANLALLISDKDLNPLNESHADYLIYELSVSEWTLLAFACFWGAVAFLIIPGLYGKKHSAWIFMAIICISIFFASAYSLFRWKSFSNTAVAVADDAPLRISPASKAPISAMIAEAQRGKIEKIEGNFAKVKMSNGKSGWADLNQISPVYKK